MLQLNAVRTLFEASELPDAPLSLGLAAGECALVEAQGAQRATALADLCSGLIPLRDGAVRFMGLDWSELGHERAAALRGRIGRTHHRGAWIDALGTPANVMLAQLHHTREPEAALARSAVTLARQLGLPGLPLASPDRLSSRDLLRAGCVRAFLGEPQLLLLETSISADHPDLTTPLLDLLSKALARGAAALCFTRDPAFWQAQAFPLDHRLSLRESGLGPAAGA